MNALYANVAAAAKASEAAYTVWRNCECDVCKAASGRPWSALDSNAAAYAGCPSYQAALAADDAEANARRAWMASERFTQESTKCFDVPWRHLYKFKPEPVLATIAKAQAAGHVVAYIDTQHALDTDAATRAGVVLDDLLVSQPDTDEQAIEIVETLTRTGAIGLIVVDSRDLLAGAPQEKVSPLVAALVRTRTLLIEQPQVKVDDWSADWWELNLQKGDGRSSLRSHERLAKFDKHRSTILRGDALVDVPHHTNKEPVS